MRITIVGKNYRVYSHLEETIEKKFDKLSKYFTDDIDVKVVLSKERGKDKLEVTVNAKGAVFRTEQICDDVYEDIDKAVDKLSRQMSKLKGKLQKRYHGNESVRFDAIPEFDEPEPILTVVKTKTLDLRPMTEDEAILEMEMLQHDFFIYLNMETDTVNVVYRRKDNNYGLLETRY